MPMFSTSSIGFVERNGIFHKIIIDLFTHGVDILTKADQGQLILFHLQENTSPPESARYRVEIANMAMPRVTCQAALVVLV